MLTVSNAKESLTTALGSKLVDGNPAVAKLSDISRQRMSIALLLEEYGPQVASSVDTFRKALHSTPARLDEEQCAAVIVLVLPKPFLSNFEDKRPEQWNLEVVAEVLQQDCRGLNWVLVAKHLDNPRLCIRSEGEFQLLARLFVRISGAPIPAAGILGTLWSNRTAQFVILTLAANSPRNIVDFAPLIAADQVLNAETMTINIPPNLSWLCLPLYARMFELASSGLAMEVLEVLVKAAALYPEYFVVSLSVVQDHSGVRNELLQRLLPSFTGVQGSKPTSLIVMRRLYSTNPDLLLKLCLIGLKRSLKVSEVVNLENIVKSMGPMAMRKLETEGSVEELLSYWCVKADRQELNLEEKLVALLEQNPKNSRFFINFAKVHADSLRPRTMQPTDGVLSIENFALLLRAAQPFPTIVPPDELKALVQIYSQFQQQNAPIHHHAATPAVVHSAAQHREGFEGSELSRAPVGPETEEVENLANAYFQKIYTTDISIVDVVNLLRQFKASSEKKEQEIFRCMIHNLFDEYRFFHKYPEKELQITGRLFGALIQNQLVSSITLGIALRYVLEALKKDPETGEGNDKMFRFGQIALDQFRSRLPEWPQYCSHLIQIPHLSRHNQDLFQEAQRALSNPQAAGQSSGSGTIPTNTYSEPATMGNYAIQNALPSVSQPNLGATAPSSVSSLQQQFSSISMAADSTAIKATFTPSNVFEQPVVAAIATKEISSGETFVQEENLLVVVEIDRMLSVNQKVPDDNVPPETVRDQIHFIVNNIAKNNIDTKGTELKEMLKSEYYGWFATYLVEKRVSSQPNLHSLYLTLLDICDSTELTKLVLDCTYYNVTKFLSSAGSTTSTTERSFIRYFGMWLGQLTLARNKPLLQKRIDLKRLLQWGYENGRLIAVCPFVAKVIEGVKESKVFRPPNPWLMAILGLLKELYEIEDLKLNIKFEVQVLCKNINVKIEDIAKTNSLVKFNTPIYKNNPDFNFKNGQPPQPQPAASTPQQISQSVPVPVATTETPKVEAAPVSSEMISNIVQQVASTAVVNPGLQYFISNPTQRRLVAIAVERGIKEILQSAVERSVAIASSTTKQLILKDFAMESNESALKSAAHSMVSSLTGSLASATCREPLRISIGNHLRTLLSPSISDQTLIEQLVQVCSSENLELGSNLIEKIAVERSIKEIDDSLVASYQARKKARESNQSFVDVSYQAQNLKIAPELAESVKLSPNGLTSTQLQLYDGFSKSKLSALIAGSIQEKPNSIGNSTGATLTMSQALESYQTIYARLDSSLKNLQAQLQGREVTLNMLGDHEVVQLLREIVSVTQRTQTAHRHETAMTFSENLFNRLFEPMTNPDPLRLEVFVSILDAVREACGGAKTFNPDVMSWLGKYAMLVNNDDMSRKIYRHILILLLRAKLLRAQDVDIYMTMNIDNGRNLFWLEVALSFIKQCLLENLGTVYDYTNTLDTVTKMRPTNVMLKKQLQKWITDIKALATAQEEQRANGGTSTTPTVATSTVVGSNAMTPPRDQNQNAKDQVTALLDRWIRMWNNVNDQLFNQFLQLMHQCGVLKTEEAADKFFKLAVEICVEACLKPTQTQSGSEGAATLNYVVIDALSKLFLLLVRLADKESSDTNVRVSLLTRILSTIMRCLLEDHESKKISRTFDQRPYYRLFSNLSQDLGLPDPKQESSPLTLQLAATYTQVYLQIQPSVAPSFAFAWLQLISKRTFMPILLRNQKGWPLMHRLMASLMGFMQPFLKSGLLPDVVKKIYRGALRVLLVMLHDFPEFLCGFHLSFCDVIPTNCVQLRNIVLSAFPRTMRLPDPFTPNLKLESVPEASQSPVILIDYLAPITAIRGHLDNYLLHQQPAELPNKLPAILSGGNGALNIPLVTSVVVYIATFCSSQPKVGLTGAVEVLKSVSESVDAEGRYVFLNTVVNQLRYPNNHTAFFSSIILSLFAEAKDEYTQEQITRVLLERLIVHRPHPVSFSFKSFSYLRF
jgi:CCR4-NOT transcription complex subunit 1